MSNHWKGIAKRAFDDWRFFDTLEKTDQQLLYAFRSFSPPFASRKHILARTTDTSLRALMHAVGESGGVIGDPYHIPFDEAGNRDIESVFDRAVFSERFKRWATSQNQELLYSCSDRFDDGFMAIVPADTAPEVVFQLAQLDLQDHSQCQETFLQLLPELRWIFVLLRPAGLFGILIPYQNHNNLLSRVESRLRMHKQTVFRITKANDRFYWRGPTD